MQLIFLIFKFLNFKIFLIFKLMQVILSLLLTCLMMLCIENYSVKFPNEKY